MQALHHRHHAAGCKVACIQHWQEAFSQEDSSCRQRGMLGTHVISGIYTQVNFHLTSYKHETTASCFPKHLGTPC